MKRVELNRSRAYQVEAIWERDPPSIITDALQPQT